MFVRRRFDLMVVVVDSKQIVATTVITLALPSVRAKYSPQ